MSEELRKLKASMDKLSSLNAEKMYDYTKVFDQALTTLLFILVLVSLGMVYLVFSF